MSTDTEFGVAVALEKIGALARLLAADLEAQSDAFSVLLTIEGLAEGARRAMVGVATAGS